MSTNNYLFLWVVNKHKFLKEMVDKIDKNIGEYFTSDELDCLARLTEFNKRNGVGKLTGSMFLDLVVFNAEKLKDQTLEASCAFLSQQYNVFMKRQSLQERFNKYAVQFLSKVLEDLLRQRFPLRRFAKEFKTYNRVLIKDSTCFQLPSDLKDKYPGSDGMDTGAAVRIQFEYDILSGNIIQLCIDSFNHQDALNAIESITCINPGDLVLRDLGYMHKKVLKKIDTDRNAIYVSRLDPRIGVYDKVDGNKYKKIDFYELRKEMIQNNTPIIEKIVYLGDDKSLITRLIISILPKEIEEKRLRKLHENRRRNGSMVPSKESITRSQLCLMVTNESKQKLPAEKVYMLYMVRWQIELLFKAMKSVCGLASIKMVQGHRVECYIYGKLIFILLGWNIIWPIMEHIYLCRKELVSFYKAIKTMRDQIRTLALILLQKGGNMFVYLKALYETFASVNILETKATDKTFLEIINQCVLVESV